MVRPGQAVNIRLDYEAHERIEEPVFGVSIDSRDGVWVWGLHGRDAGFVPRSIELVPVACRSTFHALTSRLFHYLRSHPEQGNDRDY